MPRHMVENQVKAPAFLTRKMDELERKSFEETYSSVAWMLRIFREHLEEERDALAKESESLVDHQELLKNSATRLAYRKLISYLPEKTNV